ncbi:amino acid adenylation domain-containing protein [Micromonospora sp. DSM 115977]|uniref:Amino acid adenylation domain-containing protein n=1 Tax=Micromonospora reichwaldensis TaxID=3075516 RepID=A0ABU2WTH7_9ACTN|nr:MupA/Atu3671 family FMN-dependent luciferase-like monooxygenase [Micromonospora sp. DSM 115977]MDT0529229.1 amino acid adenylation domain-containing protein [Micromonospora sp. DSM 115977]
MKSTSADRPAAVSHGGDLPGPVDHPLTMDEALLRAARNHPEAGIRIVGPDGREEFLDHGRLLAGARAALPGLRAHGLGRGSHVVLRITSGEQYWPTFFGCVLGGIVPLTVGAPTGYDADNPTAAALVHAWRVLGEPVVLAGPEDLDALAGLPLRDRVVAVAELTATTAPDGPAPSVPDPEAADTDPGSVALLQLSSGSTGRPKVIPLTHRGLSEYAVGARTMLDIGPRDVLLNWLPLDHVAGLLLYHLGGVFLGATSVHVATEWVLDDPLRWLELMRRHRVTHSWAPNFGLRLVADAVARAPGEPWDLGGVRRMVSGGEQCLPETFEAFVAATGVPAEAMTPAWGMSETSTGITFASFTEPGTRLRVRTASLGGDLEYAEDDDPADVTEFLSVGPPAPGATLRIVDAAGAVLPEGRIGRLQVSSARVTPGYLADPEATRLAFPDGDGWLETGDLAFMRDGRIAITGRAKDMIILNGHNLPCHEVEQVVGEVDGVRRGLVAAVGVPEPRTGTESLVIFYVPDDDAPATGVAEAVRAAVARRWQVVPERVRSLPAEQFPRTTGGKIRRAELVRRCLAERSPHRPHDGRRATTDPTGAPAARAAGPGRAEVRALLTGILGDLTGGQVDPARPFYELGIGSVEIVRLRARLERALERPVPQPVLFAHPTVDALSAHLAAPAATPTAEPVGGPVRDRRIAVIGMAVRFPGARTVDEYWANLTAGVESVRAFTPDELVAAGIPRDTVDAPDLVAASGVLDDDVAGFDAGFFSISAREAELLDPQHRLFLETCHHALEDAGHPGDARGLRTGLYAGSGMNLYPHHTYLRQLGHLTVSADPADSIGVALGNQPDFLATRVAYRLGLTGPAINVQNACSTSLVAVHLAVRALLDGEVDQAVAGAVAVHVPQVTGYRHTPGSILSASGRCRPFDADADGTVGGNGVAAVVLKPLDRALADGDRVHAVIIGSAVNNDGAGKVGFTAPGVAGQVDVARRALAAARVPAESIGYVEAHGTGTALGDPVEHHALAEVYAGGRPFLGSVKANIGHLDSCAGMAGLIKTILAVRSGRVAPQINFRRPNPAIDLAAGPFTVTTRGTRWPADLRPRRAAVSALGVGGTNAHVIVEEPPPADRRRSDEPPAHPAPGLLPLSAADPSALVELAARHRDLLREDPGPALADVVTSTGRRRRHLRHRLVALGTSAAELADGLDRYVQAGVAGNVLTGRAEPETVTPVALAFPGQGDRRCVVLDLAERFPVARDVLAEGADAYRRATGGDLVARLREHPVGTGRPTDVAQPALVVTAVAFAELWRSWGLTPDVVLGHSVGEYAALVVAGALSLGDAVWLAAHRGALMRDALPPGAMCAVLADEATVGALLRGSTAEIAARNGAEHHVLAGPPEALAAVVREAERRGVATRPLPVDRAFHSTGVDAVLDRFRRMIGEVEFAPTRLPLISSLDGRVRPPGWLPDADHLCRQAREPVAWSAAVATLAEQGVRSVVEAGADGALTGIARGTGSDLRWVPSQRRGTPPVDGLWRAVAELHVAGFSIDWAALTADCGGRAVPLPAYPFQRRRFWVSAAGAADISAATDVRVAAGGSAAPDVSAATDVRVATGTSAATDVRVAAGGSAASGAAGSPATAEPGPLRPSAGHDVGAEQVLARIRALTAERLGLDVGEVDPDETFLDLGADSLLLITMSREIDHAFGVRVPVRDLFAAVDTPRRLAEAVTRGASAGVLPPAAPPAGPPTVSPSAPAAPVPAPVTPVSAGPVPVPVDSAAPADPGDAPRDVPADLVTIVHRQLDLMRDQLALLGAATGATVTATGATVTATGAAATATATGATATGTGGGVGGTSGGGAAVAPEPSTRPAPAASVSCAQDTVDFSLYFFGDYPDSARDDAYGTIIEAAEFADTHDFHAVWLPERHFHSFGGLFPNPSVLAAALATRTRRLRLNAGSVVLPLHHPVRVAEEWSMVDNLSGGRVGLGCAPGWHANDFVFYPDNYRRHKQVMYDNLDTVRRLWRGEAITARSGSGEDVDIRLFPRPVQAEPPAFTAIVGNPDSYREAARRGLGVVTNLMTQDVARLAENVALYRRTRAEHGLDPAAGRVVVLLHTFLGDDAEQARAMAFEPFCAYLRSSFSLLGQVVNSLGMNVDLADTPDEDVRFVLSRAYQRYCEQRALIGSPESCRPVLDAVLDAGADEIACFVDFGLPAGAVRDGLPAIDALRRATPRRPTPTPAPAVAPAPAPPPAVAPAPAAVVVGTAAREAVGIAAPPAVGIAAPPAAGIAAPPADETAPPTVETAPLTPGQRRLWLVEQAYPGSPAYTEGVAVRLCGALDTGALRGALQDVVDRHAPLRTTYREVDGQPCQVVRPTATVDLPVREHSGADEDAVVRAAMARESTRVFDLVEGPVFAFELLRFSPTHHVLVMSFHHLATDGGSYAVLTREVGACYRARSTGTTAALPPLPVTYPELARARARSARDGVDKSLAYWLDLLDPLPPTLVLPSDRQRPATVSAAGGSLLAEIPVELTERVRQLSRVERVTPFTTLLSAIGVALFRFSGQPDLVIGTGMSGRDEDSEDLIGFFVDTVPLRLDLAGDPTFRELLARVQYRSADGYEHAGVPFDDLVSALAPNREAGRHPLFDVVVEYERGAPAFQFDLPGVTAEPIPVGLDKAPVDLVVYLSHGDTVRCHVEYRTDVLDRPTVRRLLDYVERLLDRATREPDEPLSGLAAHLDDSADRLHGPRTPVGDARLHELFLRQAARTPDAVAVVCGPTRWTYRELRERADLLARRIAAAGVGPDDLVAVLLPRRPELIAAQLAVLIAGAGFLPLDPGLPAARVATLFADSGARLLVTTRDVDAPTDAVCLRVEDPGDPDLPAPGRVPTAEQVAWCVHTSGSTGRPKGVLVPHRAAVDAVDWHVRALALTGADTVGHALGLGFDANLAEIYPALAAGATVHLVPEEARSDPAALVEEWSRGGVTVAFLPAPLVELVFALPMPAHAPRTLVVGGSQLRRRPPAGFPAEVINAYGPTECSIVATAGPVRADVPGPVDIGTPVDNHRLYLLDERGVPVPRGAVGELYVGGTGVARGYLDRPAATAAAFLPDPGLPGARVYRTGDLVRERGDGTLEFVGRVDDQVKIAGQRTEPGEAAAELAVLPGVRQATVIARHDRGDEPYLAAYVVADDDGEPAATRAERLAAVLAERLPAHLVPRAWVLLDTLPTTDNGKVDRSRLPAPAVTGAADQPSTAMEQLVHDAWCAELGVARLPVDVPFFAAGGHSLAAVRLANRLTDLLNLKVGAHRVLRSPGIRAMARDLTTAEGGSEVVDRAPATYPQELMWHRQRQAPDPPAVHMAVRVTLAGRLDVPALQRAVDGLVARHEALRTRLVERAGELVQEVLPARPGTLPVRDLAADEVEQWCVRTGREPFPEDTGPWLRARLARLDDDAWVLMLVVHHLCGDGWSMLQLLDELGRGYAAETGQGTAPAAPTARYVDHARRQRATAVAPGVLRYWRDQLAGAPRTVSFPADRPRPARPSGRGSEFAFDVPAELTERLSGLAERCGTTLFPVLASGYALLVRELTGARDVVLACPYAHRDHREDESVVGLFTSPLLLRPPLARATSFAELTAGTDQVFLDAVRHQPAPLAEVYAALDPHWRVGMPPPVATTLFGWNPGMPEVRLPGLVAHATDQGLGCARRDYATVVTPHGGGLRGVVEYSTDLFDRATVAAWCDRFVAILVAVADEGPGQVAARTMVGS